ncbi:inhibitor of growth protein 3-like [Schistocerca piceifrons]|uniref:inhibitor of growth protein 3-like n=1 Tax=Schistocerca piceifrons TaxID=274613 RepID=UPI001F5EE9F8|nr:inhibitor of growth protein 3-like [Schistocerca piceifrons]
MHHVEDYIEVYGHIPVEVKDKLIEIQNVDQTVETYVNELDSKSSLFLKRAPEMDDSLREAEYRSICDGYDKALGFAESKIQIADGVRDLLNRCFWDLCQKTARLKSELEDSCPGVTEKLERESLFCDELLEECSKKENEERYHKKRASSRRKQSLCSPASIEAKLSLKRPVTVPCLQPAPAFSGPIKHPMFPVDNSDTRSYLLTKNRIGTLQ